MIEFRNFAGKGSAGYFWCLVKSWDLKHKANGEIGQISFKNEQFLSTMLTGVFNSIKWPCYLTNESNPK